jgi:UDP-N-acetyl-D-glucosamine dehydrogenase
MTVMASSSDLAVRDDHEDDTPLGQLRARLASGDWTLGVVGLGYVGLPLLLEGARRGLTVVGVDRDADKVARLGAGLLPADVAADLAQDGQGQDGSADQNAATIAAALAGVSGDPSALAAADVVVIAVPTPLGDSGDADLSAVAAAAELVAAHARPGQLVCLESTVPVGATRTVVAPLLTARGLVEGRGVFVAFSPERIDPGSGRSLRSIPKLVAGLSPASSQVVALAYGQLVDEVVVVSALEVAELAKLLENTYRSVNIALVNELCGLAAASGVSMVEVVEAAATKPFGFAPFWPGPGVGGHCIAIDPEFVVAGAAQAGTPATLAATAGALNRARPQRTLDRLVELVAPRPLAGLRLLGVGAAYKAGVADLRESPALEVLALAAAAGAQVEVFDPVVPPAQLVATGFAVADDVLPLGWDATVVLCDHDVIDFAAVAASAPVVFDTRAALRHRGLDGPGVWSW